MKLQPVLIAVSAALLLSSCQRASDPAGPASTRADAPAAAANAATAPADAPTPSAPAGQWQASLRVVGDGFPAAGDPCRVIGEGPRTVEYLDDSATLAGCLDAADAAALSGTVVATLDGVTLVSVPAAAHDSSEAQGDALVAGTRYHATAKIACSGYKGAGPGLCDAGVVRDTGTGSYVDITLPDGRIRTIFFDEDDRFLSFSTAQADGTAAMESSSTRDGDTTIATLGSERYEIPDALVTGG